MSLALFSLPRSQQRQWLERRLSRAVLPAAKRMGDGFRLPGREGRATPAAVLIPVVNRIDGLTLLLTERSANLPDHPGQISFPGGRAEPGDVSLADTALREAREEVGLLAEQVAILGELAPYETVTGYLVTPFVGWVEPPLALKLDPLEVADVFEVPLAFLLDPSSVSTIGPAPMASAIFGEQRPRCCGFSFTSCATLNLIATPQRSSSTLFAAKRTLRSTLSFTVDEFPLDFPVLIRDLERSASPGSGDEARGRPNM